MGLPRQPQRCARLHSLCRCGAFLSPSSTCAIPGASAVEPRSGCKPITGRRCRPWVCAGLGPRPRARAARPLAPVIVLKPLPSPPPFSCTPALRPLRLSYPAGVLICALLANSSQHTTVLATHDSACNTHAGRHASVLCRAQLVSQVPDEQALCRGGVRQPRKGLVRGQLHEGPLVPPQLGQEHLRRAVRAGRRCDRVVRCEDGRRNNACNPA